MCYDKLKWELDFATPIREGCYSALDYKDLDVSGWIQSGNICLCDTDYCNLSIEEMMGDTSDSVTLSTHGVTGIATDDKEHRPTTDEMSGITPADNVFHTTHGMEGTTTSDVKDQLKPDHTDDDFKYLEDFVHEEIILHDIGHTSAPTVCLTLLISMVVTLNIYI